MGRNVWIDYLRCFITVLVVAHHSALAYTTFAYFDKVTYINSTSPVVDNSRWIGMDIFENFNDIFFMSLMFLISGLFVFKSMQKKGTKTFLAERLKRLGIPFIIGVTFIMPIAYIPSYYLSHHNFQLSAFIKDYIFNEQWPVGPPWFIWELLLFNIIAAIIPAKFYVTVSKKMTTLIQKPFMFLISFFIVTAMSFIPLSLRIGQYTWTGFGPFDFQLNRILLYFSFFVFGCCLGVSDWEKYFFTDGKLLNKSWLFWVVMSAVFYVIVELITYFGFSHAITYNISNTQAYFVFDLFFVASCISSCFAFIAIFKDSVKNSKNLWNNLSANAYGIYLLHYVFITWFQFALLNVSIPVIVKFFIVFTAALSLSRIIINTLRKFKPVNSLL